MKFSEKDMNAGEARIPELAKNAFNLAYNRALASGNNVLEARNGQLVEQHPDGTFRVLKPLPATFTVVPGKKRKLSR